MVNRSATNTSASALASAVATGIRTLGANPLRTALSTLGIIIGVAALVAVLSVGDGMEEYARRQISGTTDLQSMTVTPVVTRVENGIAVPRNDVIALGADDAGALARRLDGAVVTVMQQGGAMVERGTTSTAAMLIATLPSAAVMFDQRLASGRFLTDADVRDSGAVVVANSALAARLSPNDLSALVGDTILTNGVPLLVVGVLAENGDQAAGPAAAVPLTLASRVLSSAAHARPPVMMIEVAELERMDPVRANTEAWLTEQYGEWRPRLTIGTSAARLAQAQEGLLLFKLFMGAITGISLVVGGIGIMNVLLAAVTERTREIGIRRAVGARSRDVLFQFLAESVAITGAGSALGAALGLGSAFAITALIRARAAGAPLEAAFTWETLAVAMTAAIVIGLAFGLYPALRAARLSPIDAIRHE